MRNFERMNVGFKLFVAGVLNEFPEVQWDRWTGDESTCAVFGWIPRDDGKLDFLIVRVTPEKNDEYTIWYATSSAQYSEEYSKRLGGKNHKPCQRVEDCFTGVKTFRKAGIVSLCSTTDMGQRGSTALPLT